MNIYDFVNPMDFRYYGADPGFFERLRPMCLKRLFSNISGESKPR